MAESVFSRHHLRRPAKMKAVEITTPADKTYHNPPSQTGGRNRRPPDLSLPWMTEALPELRNFNGFDSHWVVNCGKTAHVNADKEFMFGDFRFDVIVGKSLFQPAETFLKIYNVSIFHDNPRYQKVLMDGTIVA